MCILPPKKKNPKKLIRGGHIAQGKGEGPSPVLAPPPVESRSGPHGPSWGLDACPSGPQPSADAHGGCRVNLTHPAFGLKLPCPCSLCFVTNVLHDPNAEGWASEKWESRMGVAGGQSGAGHAVRDQCSQSTAGVEGKRGWAVSVCIRPSLGAVCQQRRSTKSHTRC